ncbi:MAG: SDR family oxidoreductase [Alphaproteobacteria bacterium]|nr:SDR family oxidoreductase [Alphaproteobacteria bacterium]
MRLSGTKILLTGANGGLGRAIAAKAYAEGAELALCEKTQDLAEAAKAALSGKASDNASDKANVIALSGDLTDETAVTSMVAKAIEQMGGLDGVVNNAAMLGDDDGMPTDTPLATWQATLDTNLTGAFLVYKAALPHLIKQQSGSLVTMSSVVAHSASAVPQIAYTTSKGALEAMTREIAMAHARDNIRANCVAPGPVLTERTAHYFDSDEKWQARRQHIPMGRLGRPDEIAALVCFLLSEEAGWQTGGVYRADGGISASYVVDDSKGGSETP